MLPHVPRALAAVLILAPLALAGCLEPDPVHLDLPLPLEPGEGHVEDLRAPWPAELTLDVRSRGHPVNLTLHEVPGDVVWERTRVERLNASVELDVGDYRLTLACAAETMCGTEFHLDLVPREG